MTKRRDVRGANNDEIVWEPQPSAANLIHSVFVPLCREFDLARRLAARMLRETGTRLSDFVDHMVLSELPEPENVLNDMGFELAKRSGQTVLEHHGGLFPLIVLDDSSLPRLAIKTESLVDFLMAHGLHDSARIIGGPRSRLRTAMVERTSQGEFWAVERHGYRGFEACDLEADQLQAAHHHFEAFQLRRRQMPSDDEGFDHVTELINAAKRDLNVDLTCDLFFAAERQYWQQRNHAARVQKMCQDRLGLGWVNHDHHTYRSSREHFANLVRVFELLGCTCRERFYGGREAGWGAQVMEQTNCGIVIFADVDLATDEVKGDFAHDGLEARDQLGTVGLWCKLHGEALLQAGMHHLECQFDFAAACECLAVERVPLMTPFTDFPFLKQAFTQGETWKVDEARLTAAVGEGYISASEADQFRTNGCIGSHLEILERNDGYKGFNQTGINEIILETDPRAARG